MLFVGAFRILAKSLVVKIFVLHSRYFVSYSYIHLRDATAALGQSVW